MSDIKHKVLIVDDVSENIKIIAQLLRNKYEIFIANNGFDALEIAAERRPNLILLDIMMPDMDGFSTCQKLKSSNKTKNIPIIFLTARTEVPDIEKGFQLGAVDYITKPFNSKELMARVHTHISLAQKESQLLQLSQVAEQSPAGVIIMSSNGLIEYVNPKYTSLTGYEFVELYGQNYIDRKNRLLESGPSDLKNTIAAGSVWQGELQDYKKNKEYYWESLVVSPIKNQDGEFTHYLALIEDISRQKTLEQEKDKLIVELKAAKNELEESLDKVIEANLELQQEAAKRRLVEERLQHMAMYDNLTGLPNRSYLKDVAQKAIASASRKNQKAGIIFIDLDNFKPINDNLGHDIGDLVLVEFSIRLKDAVRECDTVARLGGDEFIVLLPDCGSSEKVNEIAMRIVENARLPLESVKGEGLSLSLGVALFPDNGDSFNELIKQSDSAMYEAKRAGKNQMASCK